MMRYKCPFCGKELELAPLQPMGTMKYFCSCKLGLSFTRGGRNPKFLVAHYYIEKPFSNKLKPVEKAYKEKKLKIEE